MTNKTAAFTIANPANPRGPTVTLNNPVDSTTAQKATQVMTGIFTRTVAKIKDLHQDKYNKLMASKQITVSFDLKEAKNIKFSFYNEKEITFTIPLSIETSKSLKDSLTTVARSTHSATPLKPLQINSLAENKNLIQRPYLPTIAQQDLLLPEKPQTAKDIPPTHNIVYQFFAAIINWVISLFSSSNYPPLIPKKTEAKSENNASDYTQKGQYQAAQRSTSASTGQTESAQTGKVAAAIRPLRNGNYICFINAIFQALMNMLDTPELRNVLINAHQAKIDREAEEIADLETAIAIEESNWWFSSSADRPRLEQLEASKEASITLNQALRTYNTTKDIVWLDALRGFDPAFSGSSEQDASELLMKIIDPIDAKKIDPELIGQLFHKIGTRKKWVLESEIEPTNSKAKNAVELTAEGIREDEGAINSILLITVPNENTNLQDLVNEEFKIRNVKSDPAVCKQKGVFGNFRPNEECLVIKSLNNTAPKYVPLQFMRFEFNRAKKKYKKIHSEIALPENNRIRLMVDGQDVDYELHTLVVHTGNSPKSGHYYSYVSKNDGWYVANDAHVARLAELPKTEEKTLEKQVYMVFLKRVDRERI